MNKEHWYLLRGIDNKMAANGRKEMKSKLFWFWVNDELYAFIKLRAKDAFFTKLYLVKRNICEGSKYSLKKCA